MAKTLLYPAPGFKRFIVASVSDNPNAFGLHGHILVAPDGEAWEVARSRHTGPSGDGLWNRGDNVRIMIDRSFRPLWHHHRCEVPQQLPDAPDAVLAELFPDYP